MDIQDTRNNTVRSRRFIFLIAVTSFALSFSALGMAPAGANQQGVISGNISEGSEISRLLVSYEPGISPVDGSGDVAGQDYLPGIDLEGVNRVGKNIFTVDLPSTVSQSEATKIAEKLEKSPKVKMVEPDYPITLSVTDSGSTQNTNLNGLWGLDRIDQRSLPLSNTYSYDQTGRSVNAYVIDTGIFPHNDFGNRLMPGFTAINDGNGTSDCNGHGTHVAGTIGGSTFGIAKEVSLVPVRVFPCTGDASTSDVIAGVNWVKASHDSGELSVANMSLGGSLSFFLDQAVKSLVADGVHVIVASGNDTSDACNYTPASTSGTITVNSIGVTDSRSSFSNYGECTDIYAPGENIISAGIANSNSTSRMSGTSMATPLVAGAMAKILQSNPNYTQSQAVARLFDDATTFNSGITGDARRLLYSPSAQGEIAAADAARIAAEQAATAEAARIEAERVAAEKAAADKAAADKLAAEQAAAEEAARVAASLPVVKKSLVVKALKKKRVSVSVAAPSGSKTFVQRKVGKKWRTVVSTTAVPSMVVKVSKAGTYRVRVEIPSGTVTSKSFRVK